MTHSLPYARHAGTELFRGTDPAIISEYLDRRGLSTPTLLLSRSEVHRNYRDLSAALPRAKMYYAVKANDHPALLAEVQRAGGRFDVCSLGEIESVRGVGVSPNELLHTHPIKSPREFDGAVAAGVRTFVVENGSEAEKLARYSETPLNILIRFRIAVNHTAVVNLQRKFGCLIDEVLPLARRVRELGHNVSGFSFHIGSQCRYADNYVQAIAAAQRLIYDLDCEGFDPRILDIGGGFPVPYVAPIPDIATFCRPIAEALDRHIRPDIQIIAEPGRYIAASPVTLVTSVIGRSDRDGKRWYYLDDGLYSTFSGVLYDQCQYPVVTERDGECHLSVLAGPTCDSFDVMYDGLMIPDHEIGDLFIFPKMGAYASVSGSSFNSLQRADYRVID